MRSPASKRPTLRAEATDAVLGAVDREAARRFGATAVRFTPASGTTGRISTSRCSARSAPPADFDEDLYRHAEHAGHAYLASFTLGGDDANFPPSDGWNVPA
jgi:hypothetical protein